MQIQVYQVLVLDADASFTAEGPTDRASEYHLQVRETKVVRILLFCSVMVYS